MPFDDVPEASARLQRIVKWAILAMSFGVVVYLCFLILLPFLSVIGWSMVLALLSSPMHRWLLRKTGRASLAAFATSAMIVVVIVVPLLFVGAVAINQAHALGQSFQRAFQWQEQPTTRLETVTAWVAARAGLDAAAIEEWGRQHGAELIRSAGEFTFALAAGVGGAVMSLGFIVITTFLMLRDGSRFAGTLADLLPFERARSDALLRRIQEVVYASVYGVLVIAIIQGALCGAMFRVLGIPSAALWGTVAIVVSVLPVVGAAAVWAPGAIYLAILGAWPKSILLVAWGVLVVSGVGHVLNPRLVGRRAQQSELAMFFALLGGFHAFGGLGIVLGPVLFAIAAAVVDVLREPVPAAPSAVADHL